MQVLFTYWPNKTIPDINEIYQNAIRNIKESTRRKGNNNRYKFNIYLRSNPDFDHSLFSNILKIRPTP